MTMARATATRCCSPAESWSGRCRSLPVSSTSGDRVADAGRELAGARVLPRDREREADVLHDVEQRHEVERLEHEPGALAPQAGRGVVREAADLLALEEDLARRRLVEPAEQLEQRALARPRRAHERDELAGHHLQAHAADGLDGLAGHPVSFVSAVASRIGRGGDAVAASNVGVVAAGEIMRRTGSVLGGRDRSVR